MSTIRTGIIGYGLSGRVFHAPFVAADPRFSLQVIATGDRERREQALSSYPGVSIVPSPDDILSRAAELDLVVLASPVHVHYAQGLAALDAGAAVIVDKPFAASTAQGRELVEKALSVGRPLIVFHNRRWDGDFMTARSLLESGRLGRVHRFESTFERFSPSRRERWQDTLTVDQGAGITFDLGSHLVDQALTLFGPATLTAAELTIVREGGVSDDDAFLSLLHHSGVRSHLTMSRLAAQSGPRLRVLGTDAAYRVYGLDPQEPALKLGARPTDPGFGEADAADWGLLGIDGERLEAVPTARGDYAGFYAAAALAIRGEGPTPVEPSDALAVLEILEQAHELSPVG
ncbi:Gfo/Idh/MocA family protein [Compostimonas suwonensis]|uniref:Putative dehydrogenase n=1 Tax=Compostimonas suwonensis TaxID=1048394 RepID=A0A2M9BZ40_9MICO|nr:Gfo/Idh/MocA family oxidoreductase [Compostimonas suwonensis]PJJ63345.1 putative dehydrogenase [Compostimonas suwonensis]